MKITVAYLSPFNHMPQATALFLSYSDICMRKNVNTIPRSGQDVGRPIVDGMVMSIPDIFEREISSFTP